MKPYVWCNLKLCSREREREREREKRGLKVGKTSEEHYKANQCFREDGENFIIIIYICFATLSKNERS